MMVFRVALLILLVSALSACQSLQWFQDDEPLIDPNSLAALQPAVITPSQAMQVDVPVESVIERYTALLPLLKDPDAKITVLHRLADLKLTQSEVLLAEQAIDEVSIAIGAYEDLLQRYPDRAENDQVLYQLAKSYDLKGEAEAHLVTLNRIVNEFPDSQYITEVQFRRGEILFSDGRYLDAQQAFEAVIVRGESSFLANAHYMKGWSLFKQAQYQNALYSYIKVLDLTLSYEGEVEQVDDRNRTMVEDLFRVMGLSFSYLGGAESLEALFTQTGPRTYEILVYDRYSQLLLEKEHFTDAIEVYQTYIAIHPLSRWSPHYQIKIIETLRLAGFIQDIQAEKERFVREYRKGSLFWLEHEGKDLDFVKAQLEVLLPELGNRAFAKAQRIKGDVRSESGRRQYREKVNHLEQAADYYAAFADTFPEHVQAPEMLYLLGESQNVLGQWPQAIAAYERAGFDYPNYEKAAEAAYASVVAYTEYALSWSGEPAEVTQQLRAQQQVNRLHFVRVHKQDEHAQDVLYVATQFAFEQQDYQESIHLAEQILTWQPLPEAARMLEAWLLIAHSYYALQQYVEAEPVYQQVLASMPTKDKRRPILIENLAACVFKQAEAKLQQGDKQGAVEQFLRVGLVAPTAKLRASAEYDAANYLIELKDWPRAISVMTDFRARYPQHAKVETLTPKLALSYRETEQWELAAQELFAMYEAASSPQEKQDTLYIVAELYDRAKNVEQAIVHYRRYANAYPEPADTYMETANRLAELYEQSDKPLKRRFWLAKQMKTVDALGDKADDRMRYLAASASSVLAEDAFIQYERIKLTLPLNETMTRKTAALEKAMTAYQKTASYGISDFSTEAGFRMADIYAKLSEDLMESERPPGLNELELEQYEILLEEQAFPFEDSAIEIHEQNASRSWTGLYDAWVKQSFEALSTLLPGRYDKAEVLDEVIDVIE